MKYRNLLRACEQPEWRVGGDGGALNQSAEGLRGQ